VRKQRTLLDKLLAAGFNLEQHILGTFTPLGERTPSSLPSNLNDLEESSARPRSPILSESNSEKEVTIILLQPSASALTLQDITIRSSAKVQQALAQLVAQATNSSALQPSVANISQSANPIVGSNTTLMAVLPNQSGQTALVQPLNQPIVAPAVVSPV
jgi:hypothetical protein